MSDSVCQELLSEPGVPWREDREHGIALSHLTGPPGTFPGDTMHHEAGCQGNKEKAETAGDQLSVCGPAASLFSTREAKQGSLEGPGAWLPASSTSTFGTHFCPEEPARHRHTHGRGSCPKDQPQPMQVGSGRIIAGPKCFLPYSSAKITLPQKNKQTKTLKTLLELVMGPSSEWNCADCGFGDMHPSNRPATPLFSPACWEPEIGRASCRERV